MKEYIKCIKRIFISVVFLLFFLASVDNIYAYRIKNIVVPKEYFGTEVTLGDDYNGFIYKKQTAAFYTEIETYNNATKDDEGWVYTGIDPNTSYEITQDNSVHSTWNSFKRIYEYVHQYQNSVYSETKQNSSDKEKYYSSGELWPQTYVINVNMNGGQYVYDVTSETDNYAGFYWGKSNTTSRRDIIEFSTLKNYNKIVFLNNNKYRWAVKNGVYISDNYISNKTAKEIWEKFGTSNSSKTLIVYNSSVTRTKATNDINYKTPDTNTLYNETQTFYKNMDTAFKFFETTYRGKLASWGWPTSTSITGSNAADSILNYYDNTFEIPKGNSKKIYVRHIDVTGLDTKEIKSTDINNSMIIKEITNGQAIEVEQSMSNGKYVLTGTYPKNDSKYNMYGNYLYNEYYEMNADDKNWVIGNIKYEHDSGYINSSGNTAIVKYLSAVSTAEQNILDNYNCVSGAVGVADSLENAVINRNQNIDNKILFDGGNYNNYTVYGNSQDGDYIVIDFYYEKKPTEIYVRHIDITNETNIEDKYLDKFLQTNAGKAFNFKSNDWETATGTLSPTNRDIKPDKSNYIYQEQFTKTASELVRVTNINYDHSTAGSYWDLLSSSQQNEYKKYTCIGAVVGKGDRIDYAEVNRNNIKKNNNVSTKVDFVNISSPSTIKTTTDDSYIEINGDYTSVVVHENNYNVVVVDFYYIYQNDPGGDTILSKRKVYVRHIDVTGKTINTKNVKEAIAKRNVLIGEGYAIRLDNNIKINKESPVVGYQEWFKVNEGINLKVIKDDNVDYTCIGSNITASMNSIYDATEKMYTNRLDKGLYDKNGNNKEYRLTTDVSDSNYVVLIDFYYKSKHEGTAIDRPTKGRLSFYTLRDVENTKQISGDSSNGSNINYDDADDDDKIMDVVASGETLRMSIDNAYVYMLGGINIKEQKIQDTYSFRYTISQNYTVNYLDWNSKCSGACGGTLHGIKNGYCGNTYYVKCTHPDCNTSGGVTVCFGVKHPGGDPETCTGSWTATPTNVSTTGTIERTYEYKVPYEYTFYKVKNMRLYTISKIELYDDYDNSGLPLFDGDTHIISPVDNYTDSFNSTNSTFSGSNNEHFASISNTTVASNSTHNLSSVSKTLATNLVFYYNNANDNVEASTAASTAVTSINSMFDKLDHSTAAKISDFSVQASSSAKNLASGKNETTNYTLMGSGITESLKDNHLHVTFYVKNDRVSFTNLVKSSDKEKDIRYIVGKGTDYENYAPYLNSNWRDESTEASAIKTIDMVDYTSGRKLLGDATNGYTYEVDSSKDKITISTKYPESIRGTKKNVAINSEYLPTDYLTDDDYFEEKDDNGESLTIPETRLNGKRYSYGKIYYNLLENKNSNLNFDASDNDTVICNNSNKSTCHDWNDSRTAVYGGGANTFVDTEMYNTTGSSNPEKTTLISPDTLNEIEWEYDNDTSNKADIVDVFTPISFKTWIVTGEADDDNRQVDHTIEGTNTNVEAKQIQKNSRFTIAMTPTAQNTQYDDNALNTDKYLMQYYIKFNYDVQDIQIHDAQSQKLGVNYRNYDVGLVTADTWIGPIYNSYIGTDLNGEAKISAFALADPNEAENIVNQESNNYTVRAVAYNAPSSLVYDLVMNKLSSSLIRKNTSGENFSYNKYSNNTGTSHDKYYDQKNIKGHNDYVAEVKIDTENLSRVYDFKITDLKDLDWKDIFRKSTTTTTNVHTSKAYYSGIKKWNVYTTQSNQLLTRDVSEIGAAKQQILPLGPYKNTNTTYVKAPKLGYKFSFDLKTTGAIDDDATKKVVIKPSFYYISKDADPENSGKPIIEDNIELFYKNSSNKYVSIDNYKLYFVPDDGYRLTFKGTDEAYRFENSNLSNSTVYLGTAGTNTGLTLTNKMMEEADNMFVQIWYGEYKLPNSTIAVKVDDEGNYNINNPLKDGYIGVKFDIEVYEYNDGEVSRVLDYNQPDGNNNNGTASNNTTQWDYEGYLGYEVYDKNTGKYGEAVETKDNIRIALEGMSWVLDQEDYEFIRGTVILYDTDAKASSDYD